MKARSLVLTAALALVAGAAAPAAAQDDDELLFIGVWHNDTARPFPSVVANGVKQAEQDLASYGVRTEFLGPPEFDLIATGQLIDAAIARNPDGIFAPIADPDAIGPHLLAATEKGIPVVTFNSGVTTFRDAGSLLHIGQDEYPAGLAFGQRLAEMGVRNAICLNNQVGNIALDERCQGMADALAEVGGKSTVVAENQADPAESRGAILGALRNDPTIDAIGGGFGGGIEGELVPEILAEEGRDDITVAFFDIGEAALDGVKAGTIDFLTSQQPFLQGYLPVHALTMYTQYGQIPGGPTGLIETGPIFITSDNVDQVIELFDTGSF